MLIKMGTKKAKRGNNHGIIVRNYEHFNKSFRNWHTPEGRYISSKTDYERALKEEGMITEKQANRQGLNTGPKRTDYKVTDDTLALIESVKQTQDKNGTVHPGDRAIDALRTKQTQAKMVAQDRAKLPSHYHDKGGWAE